MVIGKPGCRRKGLALWTVCLFCVRRTAGTRFLLEFITDGCV